MRAHAKVAGSQMQLHQDNNPMQTEVIFYTQIATLVTFVLALFGLYRLLVSAKDATIESLRQHLDLSRSRIEELEKREPGVLVESYARQLALAEGVVKRVESERADAEARIQKFTEELAHVESKLTRELLVEAKSLSASLYGISSAFSDYAQMLRYQWGRENLLHELSAARLIADHLGNDLVLKSTEEELREQYAALVNSLRIRVDDTSPLIDADENKRLMGLSLSVDALYKAGCVGTDDQLTSKGLKVMREGARLKQSAEQHHPDHTRRSA